MFLLIPAFSSSLGHVFWWVHTIFHTIFMVLRLIAQREIVRLLITACHVYRQLYEAAMETIDNVQLCNNSVQQNTKSLIRNIRLRFEIKVSEQTTRLKKESKSFISGKKTSGSFPLSCTAVVVWWFVVVLQSFDQPWTPLHTSILATAKTLLKQIWKKKGIKKGSIIEF